MDRALLATAALLIAAPASAHPAPTGWVYPANCCSNQDCRQVHAAAVLEGASGYSVPSGELVLYGDKRIKDSPDGDFHWCTLSGSDKGATICLFVPPRGM